MKINIPLEGRQIDVSFATRCMMKDLKCDSWYTRVHQGSRLVINLTNHEDRRYAVLFECTLPGHKPTYLSGNSAVEKAYEICLMPLDDRYAPSNEIIRKIVRDVLT